MRGDRTNYILSRLVFCAALALGVGTSQGARGEDRPLFVFPVDCRLGDTCVIQNYVDHDKGPGWRDYMCGALSYDGHDGTDIRLPSLESQRRGVSVFALADGEVVRMRNDRPDKPDLSQTVEADQHACGNGIALDFADGWDALYCHLERGSIRVAPGDRVRAGQPLARIGYSGKTEFPHLHVTIRHHGVVVDPMAPTAPPDRCGEGGGESLFASPGRVLPYLTRFILNAGFVDGPVTAEEIEEGRLAAREPTTESGALVIYARAIGIAAQDSIFMAIVGPKGTVLAQKSFGPFASPKAQVMQYIGLQKPVLGWPLGDYAAIIAIQRGGERLAEKRLIRRLQDPE